MVIKVKIIYFVIHHLEEHYNKLVRTLQEKKEVQNFDKNGKVEEIV